MKKTSPIDAVVTWVDGKDREHLRKRSAVLSANSDEDRSQLVTGADLARFVESGEVKYCICSIRRFAPWIRTIHLVTDNQRPEFLTPEMEKKLGVRLVDHTEVFEGYEWALPTFNSRTIETALWRIPGLAPRFVYFNDDFMLMRPVEKEAFFTGGNVILRGRWNRMTRYRAFRKKVNEWASLLLRKLFGITRSMHLLLQTRSAQLAGFERRYFRAPHVPHPIRTETLSRFFEAHPERFEKNIRYRFRSTRQFSSIFLANHLEIQAGRAKLRDSSDTVLINGEMKFPFALNRTLSRIRDKEIRFLCLQAFERFGPADRNRIESFLNNRLRMEQTGVVEADL